MNGGMPLQQRTGAACPAGAVALSNGRFEERRAQVALHQVDGVAAKWGQRTPELLGLVELWALLAIARCPQHDNSA